jgi:hypothetical protein
MTGSQDPITPPAETATASQAFHLLAKPTGAVCNLDCDYCFFLSKEMLYPGSRFRMADEVLETCVRPCPSGFAGIYCCPCGPGFLLKGLRGPERGPEIVPCPGETALTPGQSATFGGALQRSDACWGDVAVRAGKQPVERGVDVLA